MRVIQTASSEQVEAHEAANPGWLEGVWKRHQASHHRLLAREQQRRRALVGHRRTVVVPRRVNGSSGRPRSAATRSSARSGDSPNEPDQDEDPDEAPPAAREAVGACWEQILRSRAPGVAW